MPHLHPDQPLTLATLAALLASDEPVRLAPAAGEAPPLAAPPAAAPETLGPAAELLRAYAAGTGPELPAPLVRRLLLLQAYHLSQSQLGAAPALVRRLLDFFSRDVWPVVPTQGALGPGRNHIPLAHLSLPLLGLGEVNYQGYRLAAADVLGLFGWAPVALAGPEAPHLLHGAAFSLAYATEALARATPLLHAATAISALGALAATDGVAVAAAAATGSLLAVPATVWAALTQAQQALEALMAAPVGAPCLAASWPPAHSAPAAPPLLASLALGVAAVGQLSAQRTARLVAATEAAPNGWQRALPLAAASLAAQNQRLRAAPPVPAAPPDAAEALQVVANTEQLLGLELLAAAPELGQWPAATGHPAGAMVAAFREHVTFVSPGQLLAPALERAARFVREYAWA